MKRFVIVGSGLAGHNAALHLRKLSPDASITLIGQESGLPYDRPPLTKAFLLGQITPESLVLKQASQYRELKIDYRPSTRAVAIDRTGSRVTIEDGAQLHYDSLLLATGSRPRRLPNESTNAFVHYVRTLSDAARLRGELVGGRRIVIIGGGFIGLEVAASAATCGCRVTLIEAAKTLLSRGMPSLLGGFLHQLHQANGVGIMLGEQVTDIVAGEGARCRVVLHGSSIEADCVVVGIGVVPNVELAAEAGLAVDDGIIVDACCRTSDPAIYAAGEVTAHPPGGRGIAVRLESWQVAAKQSLVAAACMAGSEQFFDEPPWLWSDQFDVNIQSIGTPGSATRFLFRGDAGRKRWTLLGIGEDGVPVGAVAVNNGRDISMMRQPLRLGQAIPASLRASFGPAPMRIWEEYG